MSLQSGNSLKYSRTSVLKVMKFSVLRVFYISYLKSIYMIYLPLELSKIYRHLLLHFLN